jgi:hypothetical protein
METEFKRPEIKEIQIYFKHLLQEIPDDEFRESIANHLAYNFNKFNNNNGWTVKISKTKHVPMKDWHAACRTWIRNLPRYNKHLYIQIESAKIFAK